MHNRINCDDYGGYMNDINSYGIAMAMYHTKRIVEPCEQSRDKQERERKEQKQESDKSKKLDIYA